MTTSSKSLRALRKVMATKAKEDLRDLLTGSDMWVGDRGLVWNGEIVDRTGSSLYVRLANECDKWAGESK